MAVFGEDVAFARHFVSTRLPPTLPLCMSTSGIGYASKNYIKWQAILLAIHLIVGE